MNTLDAIILGLIQGLAEFLPISSSGHLFLAKHFLNLTEVPLLYDLMLHLATLLAVCLVFRKTIARLFMVFVRFVVRKNTNEDSYDLNLIWIILIATLITMAIGLPLNDYVETISNPKIIGFGFLYTAFLLIIMKRLQKSNSTNLTENSKKLPMFVQALIVGVMQGIAVMPGISRSGSTIVGSIVSGIKKEDAADLSFILSIPAILGGFILHLGDLQTLNEMSDPRTLIIGCLVAFVSGVLALKFIINLLKNARLHFFAYYLMVIGIITAFQV